MMQLLERPVLAVDLVLFCLDTADLAVLLHRRKEQPFAGELALPGVAVRVDETLIQAAWRALRERGGEVGALADRVHFEQLAAFDALFRDPRGRTVSIAFLGLLRGPLPGGEPNVIWQPVASLARGILPFDHDLILRSALGRLRGKIRYTNIAAWLLPETFHIEGLRAVYEAILGRRLNRSNFRSKLLRIGLIELVGVDMQAASQRGGRPPHLYRFRASSVEAEDRDFL